MSSASFIFQVLYFLLSTGLLPTQGSIVIPMG